MGQILSPLARINIFRIIPFGLIWLFFSLVYTLLERGLLGDLKYYPSTGNPYNFSSTIFITPATALLLGLSIGTIEILLLNKLFVRISLFKKIVYKSIIYIAINILILLIFTIVFHLIELKTNIFNKMVWQYTWLFFTNYAFWSVEVYIAAIIGVSLFYIEISENLGQGVLNNFFMGKYHRPIEEERIFMFLDLKSSTTIAENMGHVRYFEMLKEYFSDLTAPIIKHAGEIYQYVGDEVVVSWKLKNGLLNNNCILCFFAIQSTIRNQIRKYNEKFGIVPEFKAGFHFGKVITGEIGIVKKEIIFTGDVLNTTARIQGLCNMHEVDILISDRLMEKLDLPSQFHIRALGESTLRGREEKIELYSIQPVQI
jgi:adenylate cyclase